MYLSSTEKGEIIMKANLRKILALLAAGALAFTMAACTDGDDAETSGTGGTAAPNASGTTGTGGTGGTTPPPPNNFDMNQTIRVVTRDPASGTRGALIYLARITHDGTSGGNDAMYANAEVHTTTNGVVGAVESNPVAIGYASVGSVANNNNVRMLSIDGVAPTNANIENGSYKLSRPFNVTNNGNMNTATKDFWDFIFSTQGIALIDSRDYVVPAAMRAAATEFTPNPAATGNVVVGGSTSVQDLMNRLKAEYDRLGGTANVSVQGGGSGEGESQVASGNFQIGMVSREVRSTTITSATLAIDGVAIIVNTANPTTNISMNGTTPDSADPNKFNDVREIFLGNLTVWNEV
jgi:phosphate transport system substrate-binding protein